MSRWNKPSAVVMSEGNYSDAFIFPYIYKQNGLGKLIGMPVAGTGTAVWWETQIDPTLVFGIPMVATIGKEQRPTENLQVEPDIRVPLPYEDFLTGKDPQLEAAIKALEEVGLDPITRNRFPHEFSGGQRQRIAIARAVVLKPTVIVLDEPTSALDRSVQKQIINLLRRIQESYGLSYIFISHDLAVVKALADYTIVMKTGRVVEEGPTEEVFRDPKSDYTRALMRAAFHLKEVLSRPVEMPA